MIDIDHLTADNIGQWVEYTPDYSGAKPEQGRIKTWNDTWIFVVFKCDNNWDRYAEYTACAVDPQQLRLVTVSKESLRRCLKP